MRITGGMFVGRRVEMPPGKIRPAMDRMRESVFAALGDLTGLSFLDLFSGSGIIALEAASRKAVYIEAVEKDPAKRGTLIQNTLISSAQADAAPSIGAPNCGARIICRFQPAELYIKRAKRAFDIIFCDPPFDYEWKAALVKQIASSTVMEIGTRLLIHYPRGEVLGIPDALLLYDRREYGRSIVDFFRKEN